MILKNGKKVYAILIDPPKLVQGTLMFNGQDSIGLNRWVIHWTLPNRRTLWVSLVDPNRVYEDQRVAEREFAIYLLGNADDSCD